MNILDHRILISQSAETIWAHISDLSNNPSWQVDASNISFLTSRRTGVGVRWRYTAPNGREYVAETTAWYDGLGYEYTFVDGAPYRESKGRIRLQEIAEGTIVQWTFSYEIGGLLGGMRNAVVVKRQVESAMIDSLKTLWRVVNQGNSDNLREVKSLMRDAPNYEARAQYKPRHASKVGTAPLEEAPETAAIVEPAFSDEDTRPRVPIVDIPATDEPEAAPTAGKLETVETARIVEEPAPIPEPLVQEVQLPTEAPVIIEPPMLIEDKLEISFAQQRDDLPDLVMPPVVLPEQPVIVDIVPDVKDTSPEKTPPGEVTVVRMPSVTTTESTETIHPPALARERLKTDTSEISIFEVFGLPKPSETQEMRAVIASQPEAEVLPPVVITATGGVGLRRSMRRRIVKLRIRSQ